jgi:hypothetical protein
MAALDECVDRHKGVITEASRSLARSAREAGEYLVANVKVLDNPLAYERACQMAAYAAQLDREINGGTVQ